MNHDSDVANNLIERTLLALADPHEVPPRDIYIVLLLSLFAGLDKLEIAKAHGGWLDVRGMQPKMSVWFENHEVRVVPVQPVVATCLNALNRWDGVRFVEGNALYRHGIVIHFAIEWLRKLGWEGREALHHLRLVYCAMTACIWGWERAQSAMGYPSVEITREAAGDLILTEEEVVLWEEFRPVLPKL